MAPFGVPNGCPLNDTSKGATWHLFEKVPCGTLQHGTLLGAIVASFGTLFGAIVAPIKSMAPVIWHLVGYHCIMIGVFHKMSC